MRTRSTSGLFKALGQGRLRRGGREATCDRERERERGHAQTPLRGDYTVARLPVWMDKQTARPGEWCQGGELSLGGRSRRGCWLRLGGLEQGDSSGSEYHGPRRCWLDDFAWSMNGGYDTMSHNVATIIRVRSCNNRRGGEESKDYLEANAIRDDYHDTKRALHDCL